ncbi:putative RNA helicase [Lentinula boryana]|uniref:RNA helicase n=1 Tax=Lentinula boryana TaxID=40481 RepID=A0ABQ8Q1Q3_9AGAR|nr:putative RNA helicase [Lentinula boryana]
MTSKPDLSQYNYGAISSLVLTADRSVLPRRDREPDGAPTSLAGRIDVREMGSRVIREKPDSEMKKKKKKKESEKEKKQVGFGYGDIIQSTDQLSGLSYRPRTIENRQIYQLLLSQVHSILGGQAQDIVRTATDELLTILKDDEKKEFDKKKDIEEFLGEVDGETFTTIVGLARKITDFDGEVVREERGLDDEVGVAVVFDEEEESEEEDDDNDEEDEEEEEEEEVDGEEEDIVKTATQTKPKDPGIITPHSIDAFWVQRQISEVYPDPVTSADKASSVLTILSSQTNLRDCENELMELFEYEHFELVTRFLKNRDVVVWCTKLMRSAVEDRGDVEVAMRERGLGWILKELTGERREVAKMDVDEPHAQEKEINAPRLKTIDLSAMAFSQGGHLMSNKKCVLPQGSIKRSRKGWDEVHVPAPKSRYSTSVPGSSDELIPITSLPTWARPAFTVPNLNRIQSKLFPIAFGTDEPILLCAPTGAGKTNVALLTILSELSKHHSASPDSPFTPDTLSDFKIVYIAPMKALVQEMVGNFRSRLGPDTPFGLVVNELTGDSQMTKAQIQETQIIVTTPEKWDVVTRKGGEGSYVGLVRLMIIDEIHLLHDERGPVIESIVARTLRKMDSSGGRNDVRLVGLSATLPNYQDVAAFLRVNAGLFYFDSTYRPCALQTQFIGITEKKAIKRYMLSNEIVYEKILDQLEGTRNQTLVFVHSRKETAKTARWIRDRAMEKEQLTAFVQPNSAVREILLTESQSISDPTLKDLLPFGIAIHHAGLSRADRSLVEDLFSDGSLSLLISTATLAWGVNLPAHAVIIKGTEVYDPKKGAWVELSGQDVLQMLGRAGRPQFDTFGEGIIITKGEELQFYLSLVNAQLPIESQLLGSSGKGGSSRLVDALNAEIVLGNVRNREEAVDWLGYTYLYVRMLKDPGLYGVGKDYLDPSDPTLRLKRSDIIHTSATLLDKASLIRYNRVTGTFHPTELGRIASHFYITYPNMLTYTRVLKKEMGILELCRVFAGSEEFREIPVREEEKGEIGKLLERVPVPVKEGVEEREAKISVLLQAYISGLKLDGFALVADMIFIQQSAGRILRAMFEICLKRGWAVPAKACLDLCKMVEKRMWGSMTPLRQFKGVPNEVIRKAEGKQFPWYRYFDLSPPEIGELINLPNAGRLVHRLVHCFPKLQLSAQVQPITRSLLRIELTISPDFRWDPKIHGGAETFLVLVTDVDGEIILYHDTFLLLERYATPESEHLLTFTVPISDSPLPPNYYVEVISDRWLHSETRLPISFKHLILPERFPRMTELLDLQPLPLHALHNPRFEEIYKGGKYAVERFNKIQTQVFQALYTTDENVFVGAPTGSGKTICAEFALMRLWSTTTTSRAVCIEPFQDMVNQRTEEWKEKFGWKVIVKLTGETSADLRLLEKADVVVCTPTQWDILSRRWRQRKNIQTISLLIADEVHLVGGSIGPTYETILSRTRYVSAQTTHQTRIIALGVSLANARDLSEWIGVPSHSVFNFEPGARPVDVDIHLQAFEIGHFPSLMLAMAKPAFGGILEYACGGGGRKSVIVFVPSRKQCRLTVDDLLVHAGNGGVEFLNPEMESVELEKHLGYVSDEGLKEVLRQGIGYYHEALGDQDKKVVERLFESGVIQVLVASKDTAWSLPLTSYMVIIMSVQSYEGKEHRYVDYPVMDVLQMVGKACTPPQSLCILMCQSTKKEFYKKFLTSGLPIESHLPTALHDWFLAEIAVKTIESKQDAMDILTWSFFYRRMIQNPNYYGLYDVSHQHLSEHLSEMVEVTLGELAGSGCVGVEDETDEVGALNLGMIAAYYNISCKYVTVEIYTLSLKQQTKLKGLLEVISSSAEFESIPIRRHEDILLRRLSTLLPIKLSSESTNFDSPHYKTFLLLQSHFNRTLLPPDLAADLKLVLSKTLTLLSASIDVLSSNGWLNALSGMDLSQMCVQAVWERDSPLRQIPHFGGEGVIERCKEMGVESVYDLMDLEEGKRRGLLEGLLGMDEGKIRDVAGFVNSYPSIEVSQELVGGEYKAGAPIYLQVTLTRDDDEDSEDSQTVIAPYFPIPKLYPNWWLVIGSPTTKELYVIKKVTLRKSLTVRLEFTLPRGVHRGIRLYVVCDSYVGVDHDIGLGDVEVGEGEESEGGSGSEGGSEEEEGGEGEGGE